MSIWGWIVAALGGAGLLGTLIYWIKGALHNEVALSQRDAALQVEQQHVAAQQAAQEAQRAQRAQVLNAQVQAATTPSDVARLLRDAFPGSGKPEAH